MYQIQAQTLLDDIKNHPNGVIIGERAQAFFAALDEPDFDHCYHMGVGILKAIVGNPDDDPGTLRESIEAIKPPEHTVELTEWLAASTKHARYVTEVIQSGGNHGQEYHDCKTLLQKAWAWHNGELSKKVLKVLRSL